MIAVHVGYKANIKAAHSAAALHFKGRTVARTRVRQWGDEGAKMAPIWPPEPQHPLSPL